MGKIAAVVGVVLLIFALVWRGAGRPATGGNAAATPASVAGRFGIAFAEGRSLQDLATPALAAEFEGSDLGRPGDTAQVPAVLRHVVQDDQGGGHVGFAVSVEAGGTIRTLEVKVVRTPAGWRVADVEL